MACPLACEKVWTDKGKYDDAEKQHFERLSKPRIHSGKHGKKSNSSSYVEEVPPPLTKTHKSAKNAALVQSNDMDKPESVQEIIPKSCCHISHPDDLKQTEPTPIKSESQKSPPRNKSKKNRKNKNVTVTAEYNIHNIKNESGDSKPSEAVNIKEAAGIMFSNLPANSLCIPNETDDITAADKTKPIVAKAKKDKEKRNKADKKSHDHNDSRTLKVEGQGSNSSQCSLAEEVAKARAHIKSSLECVDGIAALAAAPNAELLNRLTIVEKENNSLKKDVDELKKLVLGLTSRIESLKLDSSSVCSKPAAAAVCPKPAAPAKKVEEDDDDGVDLFASDSEGEDDAAAAKIREERLAAYAAKKSKKPALIAKSNIILDIKPWDDETDMKAMEAEVRKITADGLLWGAAKLVPLAYGIHKLQISTVVEDDKVSIDWLQEELEKIEDFIQSVDIAAFNKI